MSSSVSSLAIRLLLPVFIRRRLEYRFLDRLLFNAVTAKLFVLLSSLFPQELPEFLDKKAMPMEKFLQ